MADIEKKQQFRVLEKSVGSDKLLLVFTALGTKIGHYALFVRQLNRLGYSVVIYDYPTSLVLNAEFDSFDAVFEEVQKDVLQRIDKLQPKQIFTFGISMGTIIANRLTRSMPTIHHVAMSLTYGDIAANIMNSPATSKTRKSMERKGLTVEDLRDSVKHFDPILNVDGLQNKKVWLHLSKRDRVLDFNITSKTKDAFSQTIPNFTYKESRYLGHYASGMKQLLNVKELDRFYKS